MQFSPSRMLDTVPCQRHAFGGDHFAKHPVRAGCKLRNSCV